MDACDVDVENTTHVVADTSHPVVPKLDISAAIPVIQQFAETPDMQILSGKEHSVTFRSEANTLREIPLSGKAHSLKSTGSAAATSQRRQNLCSPLGRKLNCRMLSEITRSQAFPQ